MSAEDAKRGHFFSRAEKGKATHVLFKPSFDRFYADGKQKGSARTPPRFINPMQRKAVSELVTPDAAKEWFAIMLPQK
jgi:hypothetical protein